MLLLGIAAYMTPTSKPAGRPLCARSVGIGSVLGTLSELARSSTLELCSRAPVSAKPTSKPVTPSGVDQLSLDTRGIDLSISKGFALLTPYAGIGRAWVNSDPKGIASLHGEKFGLNKGFVGVGTKFLVMNVNLEADKTGDVTAYSIKASIRF